MNKKEISTRRPVLALALALPLASPARRSSERSQADPAP